MTGCVRKAWTHEGCETMEVSLVAIHAQYMYIYMYKSILWPLNAHNLSMTINPERRNPAYLGFEPGSILAFQDLHVCTTNVAKMCAI